MNKIFEIPHEKAHIDLSTLSVVGGTWDHTENKLWGFLLFFSGGPNLSISYQYGDTHDSKFGRLHAKSSDEAKKMINEVHSSVLQTWKEYKGDDTGGLNIHNVSL